MGTIGCDLYGILSGKPLLSTEGTACMGLCFLRLSYLVQTPGDFLFASTTHAPDEKKAPDEISRLYPGGLLAHAGSSIHCGARCMEFTYHLRRTDREWRCGRSGSVQRWRSRAVQWR